MIPVHITMKMDVIFDELIHTVLRINYLDNLQLYNGWLFGYTLGACRSMIFKGHQQDILHNGYTFGTHLASNTLVLLLQ